MPITRRLGLWVVAAVVAAVALVAIAPAPADAVLSEEGFESCLLDKINADRVANGRGELEMAQDLNHLTRAWSEYMAKNDDFRHMTSAERNPILPDGTYTWAENIAYHSNPNLPDCSTIHTMFMNSSGHRANILNANQKFVSLGAYNGPEGWWVTELFFASDSYSPSCEGTFCDDDDSIFEADIEKIAAAGITSGCGEGQFCPDKYVTRGQMAKFLARALNLTASLDDPFTDDDDSIFEADIEKIAAAGITSGCGDGRYCPDKYVTRGQMAKFIARALDL